MPDDSIEVSPLRPRRLFRMVESEARRVPPSASPAHGFN